LDAQDRTKAGVTALATGLYLVHVTYPETYQIPHSIFFPIGFKPDKI
jgi:tRNA pseudouridine38-40 synthase